MAIDWRKFTQRPYIKSLSIEEQIRLFNIANESSIKLRESKYLDFANTPSTSQGAAGDGGITPFTNTYSLTFDGSDDYIDCGANSSLQPTSGITLSTWFMIPDGSLHYGADTLISQDHIPWGSLFNGYYMEVTIAANG